MFHKNFFWKKSLTSFSSTCWPLSLWKILKIFLEPIQSYEDVPFSGPKIVQFVLNNFFFYKPLLLLSSTYWPFLLGKIFKKILTVNLELWGCNIFGPKMVHLPQTKNFLDKKSLISFSSTYWPLLLYKIFKKFLQRIQSYEDATFLGPKEPFAQMKIFSENLLISLVPFIQAYLRAKNQSQIFTY